MRPIHRQTWQTFSRKWEVDVQHVFNWTREAPLLPLEPGSAVIAFSSGAAVNGSPLSGGYSGAKATIRFIASYAAESGRNALGIRFTPALSQLTPETDLGAAGVAAYAARQGVGIPAFLDRLGPALTPEQAGTAIVDIAAGADATALSLEQLGNYEAFVMGRVTYEKFYANWGHIAGNPYIDLINARPKYVASRSLTETAWNATLLGHDPSSAIARLKDQPGKDLIKYGTGRFDNTLM
jgi:hypothetical protein